VMPRVKHAVMGHAGSGMWTEPLSPGTPGSVAEAHI